jgi:peptidoglycan/LPS O-acetylase OafA/YrhL
MSSSRMTYDTQGHIIELQSLRGIAACAVMFGHALIYYDTPSWFHDLAILANGRAAVVIFFVLSGYVLTRSLRRSLIDRDTVLRFYVQRLFRIYPAIWAASALGLFYIFFLHWQIPEQHLGGLITSQFRTDRFDALHIIASLAAMTTFIIPQLWSIFVELVASLAIPGIAYVVLYRRRWLPGLLALAVLMSFIIPNTYYHVTMYFMDFVVGAVLIWAGVTGQVFGRLPLRTTLLVAGGLLLTTQHLPLEYYSPFAHVIDTALSVVIIGTLISASNPRGVLRSNFSLLIGDISYSIYLLHYAVLCIVAKGFAVAGLLDLDTVLLSLLLALVTAAITVPLSWLSYVYIEKPGIQLGKLSLQHMRLIPHAAR